MTGWLERSSNLPLAASQCCIFQQKLLKAKKINTAEQSTQLLPRGTAGLLPSVKLNNPIKINTVVLV